MEKSKLHGVEIDSLTGRIAKQLYQKANIAIEGFEKTKLPDDYFDVVLGNVPFGDFRVNDSRYNAQNFRIHDYFFAKALDKARAGGVVMFITSKGTMDKASPEVRKYIAQRAELLGAVRLPDNTFRANAGTEVTSDILILQKRDRVIDIEPDWVHLDTDENGVTMNSYFVKHPEMVMGDMVPDNDTSFNFLVSILYTQLFQQLFYLADHKYGGSLPVHCHFIMDEFANVSLPDDFDKIPQEIVTAVENCGFFESIPLWAVTLIGGLFITVLSFIMIMSVYGRFFKLYLYTAIAPVPLSTFAGEPSQSVGKSFIKSYAAVCLEGAIIVLACIIFSLFAATPPAVDPNAAAVSMVWSYIGELVFNMLVLVGAVKMADRVVREMMGL